MSDEQYKVLVMMTEKHRMELRTVKSNATTLLECGKFPASGFRFPRWALDCIASLVEIGGNIEPTEDAASTFRERRDEARAVGQALHDGGGLLCMVGILNAMRGVLLTRGASHDLEWVWNGVGDWLV